MSKDYLRKTRNVSRHHGSAISKGMQKAKADGKPLGRKRSYDHQEIIRLGQLGRRQIDIAKDVGCSQSVVHQVLKKAKA